MNISQFVFFDETSTYPLSNTFDNSGQASALTIQVDCEAYDPEDLEIAVLGATDMNNPENTHPLRVIDLSTFKSSETIKGTGLYTCMISGIGKISMVMSSDDVGYVKVFAVSVI